MVVIVCWICNQPFVHSGRGRRPDACPECKEQFTKKEYEKFRNYHRPNQVTVEYDEEFVEVDEFDDYVGDYGIGQYEEYEESVNIDKKDSSVYKQHLNQHGEPKKSHYSQLFKDSINTSPAINRKVDNIVAYGYNGAYPDYSEYECNIIWRPWIHSYDIANLHTLVPNIGEHWKNGKFSIYEPGDNRDYNLLCHVHPEPGCNHYPSRTIARVRGSFMNWLYHIGHERATRWALHDIEHKKFKKTLQDEDGNDIWEDGKKKVNPRIWEHTSWNKRPSNPRCSQYGLIIEDIHKELEEVRNSLYYATYLGVCIFDRHPRPISVSYYHTRIPGWVNSYLYDESGKLWDNPKKIATRIRNKSKGFWSPYFNVSNKVKRGEQYINGERKGKFKIQKKHLINDELLPGSEPSKIGNRKSEHNTLKPDRYKEVCGVCGSRNFDKFQSKLPGVDKWGNEYSWKYRSQPIVYCKDCGCVLDCLTYSYYHVIGA